MLTRLCRSLVDNYQLESTFQKPCVTSDLSCQSSLQVCDRHRTMCVLRNNCIELKVQGPSMIICIVKEENPLFSFYIYTKLKPRFVIWVTFLKLH